MVCILNSLETYFLAGAHDSVCETDENESSCTADCAGIELFTDRVSEAGSGAKGLMFTVRSTRDVLVDSLEYFSNRADSLPVEVYFREGDYGGFEFSKGAWTSVHNRTVTSVSETGFNRPKNRLTDLNALVRANINYSFYVYSPSPSPNFLVMYENTSRQTFTIDDGMVQIFDGTGVSSDKWSGTSNDNLFQPRAFRGRLM